MKSKLAKFAIGASIMLAMTFTLSCSSGDDDKDGGGSSSSGGSISSPSSGGGGGGSSSSGGGGSGSCQTGISDTFVDIRDNKSYKTVKICDQTWFAENLNYDVPGNDTDVCYDNDPDKCTTYGRLYNWATAMGIDAKYNSEVWGGSDVKHQGICPAGWHLPSDNEWSTLMEYVSPGCSQGYCANAGTKLKSADGWNPSSGIPVGTDDYGFKALPGGRGNLDPASISGDFRYVGEMGYWWSASEEISRNNVFYRRMYYDYDYTRWDVSSKSNGLYSVRCVKD